MPIVSAYAFNDVRSKSSELELSRSVKDAILAIEAQCYEVKK
jgi:hypothetical protein